MERETIKITTPISKQVIELMAWLTGGEKRKITSAVIDNTTVSGKEMKEFVLKGDVINKAQDVTFETVVINIDGNKENIVQSVLDMRSQDFDFIVSEINKITEDTMAENVKK